LGVVSASWRDCPRRAATGGLLAAQACGAGAPDSSFDVDAIVQRVLDRLGDQLRAGGHAQLGYA
jgi:hypothetical protein